MEIIADCRAGATTERPGPPEGAPPGPDSGTGTPVSVNPHISYHLSLIPSSPFPAHERRDVEVLAVFDRRFGLIEPAARNRAQRLVESSLLGGSIAAIRVFLVPSAAEETPESSRRFGDPRAGSRGAGAAGGATGSFDSNSETDPTSSYSIGPACSRNSSARFQLWKNCGPAPVSRDEPARVRPSPRPGPAGETHARHSVAAAPRSAPRWLLDGQSRRRALIGARCSRLEQVRRFIAGRTRHHLRLGLLTRLHRSG